MCGSRYIGNRLVEKGSRVSSEDIGSQLKNYSLSCNEWGLVPSLAQYDVRLLLMKAITLPTLTTQTPVFGDNGFASNYGPHLDEHHPTRSHI